MRLAGRLAGRGARGWAALSANALRAETVVRSGPLEAQRLRRPLAARAHRRRRQPVLAEHPGTGLGAVGHARLSHRDRVEPRHAGSSPRRSKTASSPPSSRRPTRSARSGRAAARRARESSRSTPASRDRRRASRRWAWASAPPRASATSASASARTRSTRPAGEVENYVADGPYQDARVRGDRAVRAAVGPSRRSRGRHLLPDPVAALEPGLRRPRRQPGDEHVPARYRLRRRVERRGDAGAAGRGRRRAGAARRPPAAAGSSPGRSPPRRSSASPRRSAASRPRRRRGCTGRGSSRATTRRTWRPCARPTRPSPSFRPTRTTCPCGEQETARRAGAHAGGARRRRRDHDLLQPDGLRQLRRRATAPPRTPTR